MLECRKHSESISSQTDTHVGTLGARRPLEFAKVSREVWWDMVTMMWKKGDFLMAYAGVGIPIDVKLYLMLRLSARYPALPTAYTIFLTSPASTHPLRLQSPLLNCYEENVVIKKGRKTVALDTDTPEKTTYVTSSRSLARFTPFTTTRWKLNYSVRLSDRPLRKWDWRKWNFIVTFLRNLCEFYIFLMRWLAN